MNTFTMIVTLCCKYYYNYPTTTITTPFNHELQLNLIPLLLLLQLLFQVKHLQLLQLILLLHINVVLILLLLLTSPPITTSVLPTPPQVPQELLSYLLTVQPLLQQLLQLFLFLPGVKIVF